MKVTIEKAIYGGAGLARAEGKAIFVPMALPGEVVEVRLRRDKGSFAEADLVAILEPSPARIPAGCPFYGACGGCQYQHASYGAQLAMKQSILEETLARAGVAAPTPAVHAAEPWGYRNRVRLHVEPATHALGYRRRGSHALLAVDRCPIAAPLLQGAIRALHSVLQQQQAGAWCAEAELFTNQSSAALLLSLRLRPGATLAGAHFEQLCAALAFAVPELSGAAVWPAAETGDARGPARRAPRGAKPKTNLADEPEGESATGKPLARWGQPGLSYQVGGYAYQVSLGAFFQGNHFLVDRLQTLATAGRQGELAWDLFAGGGLFAQALAGAYDQVVAVEGAPISAGDLRCNLPGQQVIASSTLSFLLRTAGGSATPRPNLVVLDPPRAGLGLEGAALLAAVRSQSITYVSCDPATLARDLRVLVDAGYTISQLHLVDMFPQTFHLEAVAMLELR